MTLDEVTTILGSQGSDVGYGAILFEYSLENSQKIYLNYCTNASNQLVLYNIIEN